MTQQKSLQILDELGRKKTLLSGVLSFIKLDKSNLNELYIHKSKELLLTKQNILFLGLGANTTDILELCKIKKTIYYLEYDEFIKQIPSITLPPNAIKLDKTSFASFIRSDEFLATDTIFYKQNLQLFPKFWNEIITIFLQATLKEKHITYKNNTVLLSGTKQDLLHTELCNTLENTGFSALSMGNKTLQEIIQVIDEQNPCFFLSINAEQLDTNGLIYSYLREKNIPLILWFVDNVWNIISGISQDWWKNCTIFLSDFSFAPQLEKEGAKNVYPLPLASHDIPVQFLDVPKLPLFFVGNSAFKNQKSYYSACTLDRDFEQNLYREIKNTLFSGGELPTFHTIHNRLFSEQNLWLTKHNREIGYATIKADMYLRKLWLESLHPYIEIMGDNAWEDLLAIHPKVHKPVNYFTHLPSYYKNAQFTLNFTSLLMPENLSQRHFDVWRYNGFLLSSPSKGMNIFPNDLTNAITINTPQHCANTVEYYLSNPNKKEEIRQEMQNLITTKHRYIHRIETILNHIKKDYVFT